MIEAFISVLWLICFSAAAVPTIGRWVYFHFISYNQKIQNFFDSNSFR